MIHTFKLNTQCAHLRIIQIVIGVFGAIHEALPRYISTFTTFSIITQGCDLKGIFSSSTAADTQTAYTTHTVNVQLNKEEFVYVLFTNIAQYAIV